MIKIKSKENQLMKPTVKFLSAYILVALVLVGCSDQNSQKLSTQRSTKSEIVVLQNGREATVSDSDGIRSIDSQQRIPSGSGFNVYDVDFKFEKEGATIYNIYIGGMFDVQGTVVHVDVTDMKGETSHLFIRSTAQGYQVGTYRKR